MQYCSICNITYSVFAIYWIQFGGNCLILIVLDMKQLFTKYVLYLVLDIFGWKDF